MNGSNGNRLLKNIFKIIVALVILFIIGMMIGATIGGGNPLTPLLPHTWEHIIKFTK